MKKKESYLRNLKLAILSLTLCLLLHGQALAASENAAGPPQQSTPTVSPAPANSPGAIQTKPLKGWKTLENGKRRYYIDNKYVTGLVTINKKQFLFSKKGYLMRDCWGNVGKNRYRTNKAGVIIKDKLIRVNKKVYYMDKKGVMKKGWKVFKNGKSYFNSKGVRVTGLKKIGKNYYYFKENGIAYRGWKTFKSGKSYFGSKAIRVTGLKRIKGKYYYFNRKGIMQTGTVKLKSATYYLNENGVLQARKKNGKYYHANGKAMDGIQAQDFETLQTAKSIVSRITSPQMTREQKLKTCFDWVISKPYITYRVFGNSPGWPAVYANDHFLRAGGNCHADAAAFAYLAKALGYQNVYVCVDSDGSGGNGHGWAEINGLVYDPLFAEAKNYGANYGVPYGVYILRPILHIAI